MDNIYAPSSKLTVSTRDGQIRDNSGPMFTTVQTSPPTAPTPLLAPRKHLIFENKARLATLPPSGYSSNEDMTGRVVIFLPHLPEDIELSRDNSYDQAGNSPIMPDGLWIYQYSNPLEIPLAFTLHAFDDLCTEGSKTLLDIGARLHSLVLPANNQTLLDKSKALAANVSAMKAQSKELEQISGSQHASGTGNSSASRAEVQVQYPPACSLRLIQAGTRGLGVNCVGFVKGVSVTLHGPYLQTSDRSGAFNLPSAATYKFTFVHNPTYTNTLKMGKIVQALGPDIFEYFYNTAHLAPLAKNTYADVADLDSSRTG